MTSELFLNLQTSHSLHTREPSRAHHLHARQREHFLLLEDSMNASGRRLRRRNGVV